MCSFTTLEKERVMTMVMFEIKKVLSSFSSKIALAVFAGIVVLSCWLSAGNVEWINEQGDPESGIAAVKKLRDAQNAWEGYLDEEKLTEVIRELQRIAATPEALSNDYQQNDIAYGWKQGILPIRDMINCSYAEGFRDYNWYTAESVSPTAAEDFYSNRAALLKEWLYDETGEAFNLYSEKEKAYLIEQYEQLETPFYYDYTEGWDQLLYNSPDIIMIGALILGYLVAGIFANEFKWKSDAVYFTTAFGRNKATSAKIKAGFLLVSGLYWSAILIYTLFNLSYLGFDGADCPIQMEHWKCFYNLTYGQTYLLVIIGGYIGNLFFAFLAMWVSAKTKSAVFAVTIPFILIFLPSFLDNLGMPGLSKILGLLPDRLLQISQAIRYFDVYDLGFTVMGAMPILVVLYAILTVVLLPMMYQEFRRKQIF